MRGAIIVGCVTAVATTAVAWGLTFLDDPGPLGRALATALALCLTALPTGVAAGLVATGWKRAATAAATSSGVQLTALATYCAMVWKGGWDLPAIVSFAILLQALALMGSGVLVGVLRRPARPPD